MTLGALGLGSLLVIMPAAAAGGPTTWSGIIMMLSPFVS